MHVYKLLEPSAWAVKGEGAVLLDGQAPGPEGGVAAEMRSSLEAEALQPGAETANARSDNNRTWYKRPPGWALRWEGSALTMNEE